MANEAYYSEEHFRQQRRILDNGDPRALICFCVDVSGSMSSYWIQEGGLRKTLGSGARDGESTSFFNLSDIRPGYKYYKKIDKLNETLSMLLRELKNDKELRNKVAVSIVTYSEYARVKYDFLDSEYLDVDSCICRVEKDRTSMGDGLRTSLAQIDEMQNRLQEAGNDSYTPILVFMTDGTPTDDPRKEFDLIRQRVENEQLFVFPLGIGENADMARLRNMYPLGKIPQNFSNKYCMVDPEDYRNIFNEIKSHVREKQRVMVSEGNSKQSAPVLDDVQIDNTQSGEDFDLFSFV